MTQNIVLCKTFIIKDYSKPINMTNNQWNCLLDVIQGKTFEKIPAGFIIDSPWLPNWYGISILDYFSNDELWFQSNLKAMETFPQAIFLPGFWSEYGMCTEPSAFGAGCMFPKNEFPFAYKVIHETEDIDHLHLPNVETDGLLPFVLNRLLLARKKIEAAGHEVRFSVSRGPLNIASFLMGSTEFLMAMMMDPQRVHALLRIITDFLKSWHQLQRKSIDSIDGIMMLDDIVGFIGEDEFMEFGYPYLKELYDENVSVKFFHNDADCRASVKHYPSIGINLYNPGIQVSIKELKEMTQNQLTILGSVPPRDVLAKGTPDDVRTCVAQQLSELNDHSKLILSCAGGMPPNASTENIRALIG